MKHRNMFYSLVEINWIKSNLTITIAELVEGNSRGFIGTLLVVNDKSIKYNIKFKSVADFRARPEACFVNDGIEKKINNFLSEFTNSKYIDTVCPFGDGAKEGKAKHYCIATEEMIIEVLSDYKPEINIYKNK